MLENIDQKKNEINIFVEAAGKLFFGYFTADIGGVVGVRTKRKKMSLVRASFQHTPAKTCLALKLEYSALRHTLNEFIKNYPFLIMLSDPGSHILLLRFDAWNCPNRGSWLC